MLLTDWATPNMPPCSSAEVLFEMKLGIVVFIVPMLKAINVIETRKIAIFGIRGMRNIPIVMSRDPNAMSFSSPTLFTSIPIRKP